MSKTTIGLLLLLAATGCGKHAAAHPLGHGADTQKLERNEPREDCQWKRPLFC